MELVKEITAAAGQLSGCQVKFLEFVQKNPRALTRANYTDLFGLNLDEGPVQPWPTFVNQHLSTEAARAGTRIIDLIKSIPERLFGRDVRKIGEYYGIPENVVRIQMSGFAGDHLEGIIGRGDFILSGSGLKCIEFNISANVGGWQLSLLKPLYARNSIISKFLQEHKVRLSLNPFFPGYFENVLRPAVKRFAADTGEINTAIMIPTYRGSEAKFDELKKYVSQIYNDVLSSMHSGLQGSVMFCDHRPLNTAGGYVFAEGRKIHIVIEMYHGEIPAKIWEVFRLGNVLLYNGPVTRLLSNKLNLALLSESENSPLFSPEERKIIERYIPWTRKIAAGDTVYGERRGRLKDVVLENRERMVIKPPDDFGGKNIYVGKLTPQVQWQHLMEAALEAKGWVVQEYVESLPHLFQWGENGSIECEAVWGLFILGSTYGGGFLRLLPREKKAAAINVHQGAEVSPLLEVEE